ADFTGPWGAKRGRRKARRKSRPHPEERRTSAARLEGWPLARPCLLPSFETAAGRPPQDEVGGLPQAPQQARAGYAALASAIPSSTARDDVTEPKMPPWALTIFNPMSWNSGK